MYIEHRKTFRKPISLQNEIDLLLHFPFAGLIGWGLLPLTHTSTTAHKYSVRAKLLGRNRNVKHYFDTKNLDLLTNIDL